MRRVSDVCQEGPMNERVNLVLNSAYWFMIASPRVIMLSLECVPLKSSHS